MAEFDDVPPPYVQVVRSTYLGGSPEERDDEARSMPSVQFQMQADLEKERIHKHFRPGGKFMKSLPMDPEYGINKLIFHNLKKRWIQWGIWDDNWVVAGFFGHWMHEDIASKGEPPHVSFPKGWFRDTTNPGFRYIKKPTDSAILDKSRPINQFWSQVAHERLYLEETGFHDATNQNRTIDEQAQENIRHRWIRQKLWSKQWHDVPGDTWDHESIKSGVNLKWFYRQHPFECDEIQEIAWSLPADEDMWFRREPDGGENWNFYVGHGPGPRIVPCSCTPSELRRLLWEQPCVPVSKLRIQKLGSLFQIRPYLSRTLSTWNQLNNDEVPNSSRLEQNKEIQDSLELERKNNVSRRSSRPKQNDELKQKNSELRRSSRLKQNDDEPRGSLHIKHNNGELRRSSRLIQKREQLATSSMISKSIAKRNRAKRGKKVNATKRKAKTKQSRH